MDDNQRYSLLPLTLRKQVNCNLTDIVISSMERVSVRSVGNKCNRRRDMGKPSKLGPGGKKEAVHKSA